MISSYYGFWDYWNLYHKVTFDGINKLILINDGETELDFQIDVYSSWKEWSLLEDNLKYLPAFSTIGGEPTVAGQKLDVTYFLINGWKLKPYPGSYDLNIIGNVFDVDGGSIKVAADKLSNVDNNISISTNTSVIVRQITGNTDSVNTNVTASIDSTQYNYLTSSLYNIENRIISIENKFNSPITASLVDSQLQVLIDIQTKLTEIHQLHGLDSESPLTVNTTQRAFGDIVQTIQTTGEGATQETIITRV